MKFYPGTITETQRARLKRNSLAATRPGVRKDRLGRDVIIIIIIIIVPSFATNQGAVAPIRERSLPPNQTRHMTRTAMQFSKSQTDKGSTRAFRSSKPARPYI